MVLAPFGLLPDLHLHNYSSALLLHFSQVLSTVAASLPVIGIQRKPGLLPRTKLHVGAEAGELVLTLACRVALNGWLELREAALGTWWDFQV